MDTQGHAPSPSLIAPCRQVDSSRHARCHGFEGREAKVRELRERIQNGTYQGATAEQIAERMLLETLGEELSGNNHA